MLHDDSFITGFLIGDKKGYNRGYDEGYGEGIEEGGGGSAGSRDTIEFGDGMGVDIWRIPAYTECPINGSTEDTDVNKSMWALYRAQHCCGIMEMMYGIYAVATMPNFNILTGQGYGTHKVTLTNETGWETITNIEYTYNVKQDMKLQPWDEDMWLVVSPTLICCITKAAGQYTVPAVLWGFAYGQNKDGGEWKPWYGPNLYASTFGYDGTAGDLSSPTTTVDTFVDAYQEKVSGGQVDNLWYIRNTNGIVRDEGSVKVVPSFKSVGTVTTHESGRRMVYLAHNTTTPSGSYPGIYNMYFILLPKGVNSATWRGLIDREILKGVSLLDGKQWLWKYNEDEIKNETTPNSYYSGYNKGYEDGLAASGGGSGEPDGSYDEGYQKGYQDGYRDAQTASGGDDGYTLHPAPDGATELYISIEANALKDMQLCFSQTVSKGVSVDWGDGTKETFTGTGAVYPTHTYAALGEYIIRLLPDDGCVLTLGNESAGRTLFNGTTGTTSGIGIVLKKAVVGKGITTVGKYAFQNCWNLEEAYISDGIENLGGNCFMNDAALHRIRLPETLTTMGAGSDFAYCTGLSEIKIPAAVTAIGASTFGYCYALGRVSCEGITSLGNGAFQYCRGLYRLDLPETLESIGTNLLSNAINCREIHLKATTPPKLTANMTVSYSNYVVYIPKGSLEAYSEATYWKNIIAKFIEE